MSPPIRWLLILPAAIVAWFVALFTCIALHQGIEALCSLGQKERGGCYEPWFWVFSRVLPEFGAALAAALVLIACTLVAPARKRQVAIAAFAIGAVVAIIMGWGHVAPIAAAIISGSIVLAFVLRRLASISLPNKSLERTREG